jgi:Predicted transcriptional regulators
MQKNTGAINKTPEYQKGFMGGLIMEYTIKDAAKESRLTTHTIRYYEQEGLLPSIDRDKNGNRIFKDSDIEWLLFVRCLRETGMSIEEMKYFVKLSMEGEHTLEDRKRILQQHRRSIEDKIEQMKHYLKKIDEKMTCYNDIGKCK